jgi:hypothetical protein
MKRSKKIFLALSAIFLIIMMIIGYDLSQRTTFPGSRTESDEIEEQITQSDSLNQSTKSN